jgi:formate hydrogenlyase transcriptional activator
VYNAFWNRKAQQSFSCPQTIVEKSHDCDEHGADSPNKGLTAAQTLQMCAKTTISLGAGMDANFTCSGRMYLSGPPLFSTIYSQSSYRQRRIGQQIGTWYRSKKSVNGEFASEVSPQLVERLRFETLIADLSSRFVNVQADRVDREIEDAQRAICECLVIEHSAVWQTSESYPDELVLTHLYRDPGLQPPAGRMSSTEFFPWAQTKLLSRQIVCVPNTAEAPPEAKRDMESWRSFGIKSTLGIPLSAGFGAVFGVLSFDAIRQERAWPETLQKRLVLIAQVFANALERKRADQRLRESEARLSLAANSANAGLWTLEPETGQIWATEKAFELFGLAPSEPMNLNAVLSFVHLEDRERLRETIREAMRTGDESAIEYRVQRPDGTVRWIASRGRRRAVRDGEPERLMGVSIDVSESKRVELELLQLRERLQAESDYLKEEIQVRGRFDEIVGQSQPLRKVFERIEQVSPTDSMVLITGETGTGKELVARAIHGLSRRKTRVMVKVDCSSLPAGLIESELFGREKGALANPVIRHNHVGLELGCDPFIPVMEAAELGNLDNPSSA